jgi:hypothetical protein
MNTENYSAEIEDRENSVTDSNEQQMESRPIQHFPSTVQQIKCAMFSNNMIYGCIPRKRNRYHPTIRTALFRDASGNSGIRIFTTLRPTQWSIAVRFSVIEADALSTSKLYTTKQSGRRL